MAQVAGLRPLIPSKNQTPYHLQRGPRRNLAAATYSIHTWSSLQQSLNCSGKFSCLFSDNRKQVCPLYPEKQSSVLILEARAGGDESVLRKLYFVQASEQARKALESALGEKKIEFEKWDKEIKRREEAGGGGNSGGGGWFRWGRWFGGSDGDQFWQEAQQASLAILAILVVYLIVAKGDVMLAVVFNPLLFALRGTRTGFTFLTSKFSNMIHPGEENIATPQEEMARNVSAKERVMGKWGSN